MRDSKKTAVDKFKVLIVYDEVTEGTHLYLVDATLRQLELLKTVNGAYVNSDDITDKQLDTLSQKILPALDANYAGDDANEKWKGIWQNCKLDTDKMPKIPACQVFLFGFLP